ncbi:hypothetical protein ACJ41O_010431 [Fusarium nematophilum]
MNSASDEKRQVQHLVSNIETSLTWIRSRPRETVKVLYDYELRNAPGKSIVGIQVHYVPNGWTPPHTHAGATVVATVTQGRILSGMNGNPPRVYQVGESFMELPGCHHTVSDNDSETEEATLVAVLVVDTEVIKTGYGGLTVIDEGYE